MRQKKSVEAHMKTKLGRPSISDAKRRQMREKIASSAHGLFRAEGYGQVSMRRIANDVGCSPMTLYKYYDAKIDILKTLWADVIGELFDQLEAVDANGLTPQARLTLLASTYVDYWLDHSEHYRLVFIADGVTQPDVGLFLDNPEIVARYQVFAVAISETIGELSADALKLKLDSLICLLHGIAHNLITISGYQWSAAHDLVAHTMRAIIDA